jgi:hypothetical protein
VPVLHASCDGGETFLTGSRRFKTGHGGIMKMLVIIYNHLLDEQIKKALADNKMKGYSEIPRVFGSGEVGTVEDSRHAPGYNSCIFAAMPDERVQSLLVSLGGLVEEHKKQSNRPMQLHVFSIPCEKLI